MQGPEASKSPTLAALEAGDTVPTDIPDGDINLDDSSAPWHQTKDLSRYFGTFFSVSPYRDGHHRYRRIAQGAWPR